MNTLDRLRVRFAAARYAYWLDARGVRGRRRRELRDELRANLTDAAGRVGAARAIAALGGTRRLAAEAVHDDPGPRWASGVSAAAAGALGALTVELMLTVNYMHGALDTGARVDQRGSLVPFPGSVVHVVSEPDRLQVTMSPGWFPLVAAVLAFITVARPWRLVRGRARVTAVGDAP